MSQLLPGGQPRPYLRNDDGLQAMIHLYDGKTLLFTDHADRRDEGILAANRSQAKIEDAFQQMKDVRFIGWRPLLHWTEQKVAFHAAYRVFALLLSALAYREVRRANPDQPPALDTLMQSLAQIQGVVDLPQDGDRQRPCRSASASAAANRNRSGSSSSLVCSASIRRWPNRPKPETTGATP